MKRALWALCIVALAATASAQTKTKVRCEGAQKSRTLFAAPGEIVDNGEVKCGKKVSVLGAAVSQSGTRYIRVSTEDGRTGFLMPDAIEKSARPKRDWNAAIVAAIAGFAQGGLEAETHNVCADHGGAATTRTIEDIGEVVSSTGQVIGTVMSKVRIVTCKDGSEHRY
jgi:hypothetical protein